jgi:hypothetical protein
LELLISFNRFLATSSLSIVAMERLSMTMQFVDGFLAAMLPSMFTVAWMLWRADPHQDFDY